MNRRDWKRPGFVALAALLLAPPCLRLLTELAYAVHPSDTQRFGAEIRVLFTRPFNGWIWWWFLRPFAFLVCFTVLQEFCLDRWPMRRHRLFPATMVILALTALVAGTMSVMGGLIRVILPVALGIGLWIAPWIAFGYLVRSSMRRLEQSWARWWLGLGSVLAAGLALTAYSYRYGNRDGEVQALSAMAAALPVVLIIAGGFSDLFSTKSASPCRRRKETQLSLERTAQSEPPDVGCYID
jgi:hypothetical protein